MWVKTQKDRLNYCNSMVWNCLEYFDFNLVLSESLVRAGSFGSLGSCRGPGRQRTQTLVLCFLGLSARFGRPGRPGVNQV